MSKPSVTHFTPLGRRRFLLAGLAIIPLPLCILPRVSQAEGAATPMADDAFWALIDLIQGSRVDDATSDLSPLIAQLSSMSAAEITSFYETLALKTHALDTRANYAQFSAFPGLADSFLYARLATVAQGESFYKSVLEDPAKFADVSHGYMEQLLYVADEAYRAVTGTDFPRQASVSIESFQNEAGWK